ncbi:hypothetical protein K8R42_05385 [bacterium]|nr:hypothetical protein [bacterium]
MSKLFSILYSPFRLTAELVTAPLFGGRRAYRRDIAKLSAGQKFFVELVFITVILAIAIWVIGDVIYYARHGVTLFGPHF